MKKLFLFAVAGLLFAATGSAQVKRNSAKSQTVQSDSTHHFRRGNMMDNLNLTAEQKAQMKTMREDAKQQRAAIQNDASLTPDQKEAKMKELHKTQSDKMNSILTPEQQATWKANMQQMKENRKMNGRKSKNKVAAPAS
ncbi:MAG: Spy/CpxP family protein refolding chaperone [Ginsengibacter sp.]